MLGFPHITQASQRCRERRWSSVISMMESSELIEESFLLNAKTGRSMQGAVDLGSSKDKTSNLPRILVLHDGISSLSTQAAMITPTTYRSNRVFWA